MSHIFKNIYVHKYTTRPWCDLNKKATHFFSKTLCCNLKFSSFAVQGSGFRCMLFAPEP